MGQHSTLDGIDELNQALSGGVGSVGGMTGLGMGLSMVGGAMSFFSAQVQKNRAESASRAALAKLNNLLNSRQAIVNPYSGITDLSGLVTDLSGMISNPYANLGVATGAAEIQIEEADIALANTLDTIRATGASAGGATALAQAALRSKKGVSANIEQQESQNEKLKAQGEQQLMQLKMSEQQRLQGVALSEGQRIQGAQAAGKQFMWQAQEQRTDQEIAMATAQLSQAQQGVAAGANGMGAAIGSTMGAVGGLAGSYIGAAGSMYGANSGNPGGITNPNDTYSDDDYHQGEGG
jgi:hypothetical protein